MNKIVVSEIRFPEKFYGADLVIEKIEKLVACYNDKIGDTSEVLGEFIGFVSGISYAAVDIVWDFENEVN